MPYDAIRRSEMTEALELGAAPERVVGVGLVAAPEPAGLSAGLQLEACTPVLLLALVVLGLDSYYRYYTCKLPLMQIIVAPQGLKNTSKLYVLFIPGKSVAKVAVTRCCLKLRRSQV